MAVMHGGGRRSRRQADATVECSLCGRQVPGWASAAGGFYVRRHMALEGGRMCHGAMRTDHQEVQL